MRSGGLPQRDQLVLVVECGSGTDEAHVAPQDVPELGQLVQAGLAQELPHPRDIRAAHRPHALGAQVRGVLAHRPELQHREMPAVESDPALAVVDGPCVVEPDRRRDGDHERGQEYQSEEGESEVEDSLQGIVRPPLLPEDREGLMLGGWYVGCVDGHGVARRNGLYRESVTRVTVM